MISIIDYGVGNVLAFANVYHRLDIPAAIASTPEQLENASKLILPGVGAFDHAVGRLNASGMRPKLDELVRERRVPILGVCVGMQMLAASSEEGDLDGLGWVGGEVLKLDAGASDDVTRLPHMGWNDVAPVGESPLFSGLEHDARFYFLHSYYFQSANNEDVLAETHYGITFSCAVQSGNTYGVQFHPEKSHRFGTRLLKNFAEL